MNLARLVKLKERNNNLVPKYYGSKKYMPKSCYINHTRLEEPYPTTRGTMPNK